MENVFCFSFQSPQRTKVILLGDFFLFEFGGCTFNIFPMGVTYVSVKKNEYIIQDSFSNIF